MGKSFYSIGIKYMICCAAIFVSIFIAVHTYKK